MTTGAVIKAGDMIGKMVVVERIDPKVLGDDKREANVGHLHEMSEHGVLLVDEVSDVQVLIPWRNIRTIQLQPS